jgi:hypothetical protein
MRRGQDLLDLARGAVNVPGWRTRRRILVLESDDWGAVRMPSRTAYNRLLSAGIRVDRSPFCRFDSLASETDLSALFDTLSGTRDGQRRPAVITANCIMANPDFERIRRDRFEIYHYTPFTDTLREYPEHSRSFELWQDGIRCGVLYPQLHGREHVNVARWMRNLKAGLKETLFAFELGVFGIDSDISLERRGSYLAALDFDTANDAELERQLLLDAVRMFESCFGFTSRSFIAPKHTWSGRTEQCLAELGVRVLQSGRTQRWPAYLAPRRSLSWHYTGQRNGLGQTYIVRNCSFEPALGAGRSVVGQCLRQIATAFRWGKPAVVGTHRINYVGFIDPSNRDRNLKLLCTLLTAVVAHWPDVEFMTTEEAYGVLSGHPRETESPTDDFCPVGRV